MRVCVSMRECVHVCECGESGVWECAGWWCVVCVGVCASVMSVCVRVCESVCVWCVRECVCGEV